MLAFIVYQATPWDPLVMTGVVLAMCSLGVLSVLAGLSLLTFLSPTLGPRLFAYVAAVGLIGAVPQILWLLVVGVNEQRWKEQASAAAASLWR